MPYTTIEVHRDGPLAEIVLTGKRGALAPDFWRELPQALGGLDDARAVVIRGQDDFSVGLDLPRTAPVLAGLAGNREGFLELVRDMQAAIEAVAALRVPTVAAIHGWCIGAGLELASACDLRVGAANARFSLPEVKLGIVADLGGLSRLPRLVGEGWARRLALTAEAVDASTAERIGLVSEVLPTSEDTLRHARALASLMAALPPRALEGTKAVLEARAGHTESLRLAAEWNADHLDPALVASALKR